MGGNDDVRHWKPGFPELPTQFRRIDRLASGRTRRRGERERSSLQLRVCVYRSHTRMTGSPVGDIGKKKKRRKAKGSVAIRYLCERGGQDTRVECARPWLHIHYVVVVYVTPLGFLGRRRRRARDAEISWMTFDVDEFFSPTLPNPIWPVYFNIPASSDSPLDDDSPLSLTISGGGGGSIRSFLDGIRLKRNRCWRPTMSSIALRETRTCYSFLCLVTFCK